MLYKFAFAAPCDIIQQCWDFEAVALILLAACILLAYIHIHVHSFNVYTGTHICPLKHCTLCRVLLMTSHVAHAREMTRSYVWDDSIVRVI